MSTATDFEDFWNWHHGTNTGLTAYFKALAAKFPNNADKREYVKLAKERRARAQEETTVTPISRNNLTEMIAKMNYNSVIDRGKLVSAIKQNIVLWFPVGSDRDGRCIWTPVGPAKTSNWRPRACLR
jgi:hypothetical protein